MTTRPKRTTVGEIRVVHARNDCAGKVGWRGCDGDVGRYRGGEGDNAIRAGNERLGMHK
jgi:hypothetical protein